MSVRITRVANACVLLEFGTVRVLTDPWFTESIFFTESASIPAPELPPLGLILGGHWAYDHWDIGALADRARTPVRVADASMLPAAQAAGFMDASVLEWDAVFELDGLTVQAVPEHTFWGKRSTNFVLTDGTTRVFVGTECRDLEPALAYGRTHPPCDIAIGPVNGVRLLGSALVADASRMVEITRAVGARTLVPIHDSHRAVWPLQRIPTSAADLDRIDTQGLEVRTLAPGECFEFG